MYARDKLLFVCKLNKKRQKVLKMHIFAFWKGFIKMRLSNRNLILLAFDMVCFAIVSAAYYIISLALSSVEFDFPVFLINVGVLFGVTFILRLVMGMYGTLWRYTSTKAAPPLCPAI